MGIQQGTPFGQSTSGESGSAPICGKNAKQASTSGIRKNARRKGVRFIESIAIGAVVVDLNKFIVGCVCRFIYFFLFSRPIDFLKQRALIFFVGVGLCSPLTKGKNPNRFRKNKIPFRGARNSACLLG